MVMEQGEILENLMPNVNIFAEKCWDENYIYGMPGGTVDPIVVAELLMLDMVRYTT